METCGHLKNVFLAQNETHDHEAVGNVDDGDGCVCATRLVARFHCPSKSIYTKVFRAQSYLYQGI